LLVVGVVYFVFHSGFFKANEIAVFGSIRDREIKEALIGDLLKTSKTRSLLGSENLLFWPPKEVKKIPSSLFWLSNLNIERNWQEKKIIINVTERKPWLLWCLAASGNCYWVDEGGIVFSSAPEAEGFIIPKVFEQGDRREFSFGQPLYENSQMTENVLEIIKQTKNSSFLVSGFFIENPSLKELIAQTSGLKLYFSLRFLFQNLDKIFTDLAGRLDLKKLEYIDFRVENRIYYK